MSFFPFFFVSVFPFLAVLFLRHYLSAFPASLLHLSFILSDRIKCRHVPYIDCPSLIKYFFIRRRASCHIPIHPFIHCSSSPLPVWTLVNLIAFPSSFRTAVPALISIPGLFPVRHLDKCQIHERAVFYLSGFIHWLHVCFVNG